MQLQNKGLLIELTIVIHLINKRSASGNLTATVKEKILKLYQVKI